MRKENEAPSEYEWRTKIFSARMDKRMRRLGMNNLELSKRTGISTNTISYYRRGKTSPSAYYAMLIAKELEMFDTSDLVDP